MPLFDRTIRPVRAILALALSTTAACATAPPPSRIPSAEAAIARIRTTGACATGVHASAKIDHFGSGDRVRGDLLMYVSAPASIRMDIVSPFGVTLATLTSDGTRFALADLRDKRFLVGRATACNIARLTTLPIPGHVLVELLRGQPPVVKHPGDPGSLEWSGRGYYVVRLKGTRDALEEIHLAVDGRDWAKPWNDQRLRLLDVEVAQRGEVLYRAELDGHEAAHTAQARVDPDGIDPPIPPSGPACDADVPRRIRVRVPWNAEDVMFRYDSIEWNPPLPEGAFTQPQPAGMPVEIVDCD